MGIQTDKILEDIQSGTSDDAAVDFIDISEVKKELEADISAAFPSRNKFADACAINSSQLSEFLKGTKNIGRDLLLSMLITLEYDIDRTQRMLTRLGMPALYVRNVRDYQIALAIREHKSLDETDQLLQSKNLKTLTTLAKNK